MVKERRSVRNTVLFDYDQKPMGQAPRLPNAAAIAAKRRFSKGVNNKAKWTLRKAYGFKVYETITAAFYHHHGNLP